MIRRLLRLVLPVLTITATLGTIAHPAAASAPPANDNFANATIIAGPTGSTTGDTTGATMEPGEPGGYNGRTIWYRWTAPTSGTMTFNTCGSALSGVQLGVYTGASIATLTAASTRFYYDVCSGGIAFWQFRAAAGTAYSIQVYGMSPGRSNEGTVGLSWNLALPPANDDWAHATTLPGTSGQLTANNQGAFAEPNEPFSFGGDGHTVWYQVTPTTDGLATFDTCGTSIDTVMGVYTGSSIDTLAPVDPMDTPQTCSYNYGERRFHAVSGVPYFIQLDGSSRELSNDQGPITLNWSITSPSPPNDNFANATVITGATGSTTGTTASAFMERGEPATDQYGRDHTVWYQWQAPVTGRASFSTCGTATYTPLSFFTGASVDALTAVQPSTPLNAYCDSYYANHVQQVHVTQGGVYYIRAAGPGWQGLNGGSFSLNWSVEAGPPNDNYAAAQVISGASGSVQGDNTGAYLEPGEPAYERNGYTAWYSWTAPFTGLASVDTCGSSNSSTEPMIYTGPTVDKLTEQPTIKEGACSPGSGPHQFHAVSGRTYGVQIDDTFERSEGPFNVNWSLTPPPPNDDLANAQTISGPAGSVQGTNVGAFYESPNEDPTYGGHTVWYRWQAPRSGTVRFWPCGDGNYNATVAIYAGSAWGSLARVDHSGIGGSCSGPASVSVTRGTVYSIQVNGCCGAGYDVGNFALHWSFSGATADFDGDMRTDLGIFRPSADVWLINAGHFPNSQQYWGASGDIPVPADYEGHGITDTAVYRPSTGAWFIRNTDGTMNQTYFGNGSDDIPVPADYDGDGITDLAVYRPSAGLWLIRNSHDGSLTSRYWGSSGDAPVPGDYDGDGKADIAVYRQSSGQWFIVNSNGGGTSQFDWGNRLDDVPVPGDYDGDGATDIAVYRPSTGGWFVIKSSGGTTQSYFGSLGDVPQPGDYDRDGTTDFAVFRRSAGAWFVQQSSGGTAQTYWGNTSNDVPLSLPYAIRHQFFPSL